MVFIINNDMMSQGVGCIWIEAANNKHILTAYFIDLQDYSNMDDTFGLAVDKVVYLKQ